MDNSSKMGKKISLCMFGMIFTIMFVLTVAVTSTIVKRTKDDAIKDMKIITSERSQIIENYVKNAEKTLIYYSQAGEISDILANPNSLEAAKRAQSYTEKFSHEIDGIEAIYVSDWNTRVLAHTNPAVPGKVTREGDALKPFQDGILSAKDGVYNFGIINSPASGQQVHLY